MPCSPRLVAVLGEKIEQIPDSIVLDSSNFPELWMLADHNVLSSWGRSFAEVTN
jgi:hypothetical protein